MVTNTEIKQELQEVLKFQIEIFWNLEARNLISDLLHLLKMRQYIYRPDPSGHFVFL